MKILYINILCFLFILLNPFLLFSDNNFDNTTSGYKLKFEENKKQWNADVLYKVDFKGGRLFLEKNQFTFAYYSLHDFENAHERNSKNNIIRCHSYKVKFIGSNKNPKVSALNKQNGSYNYFLGNDSSKWASDANLYGKINYNNIYPDIDINIYSQALNLKYEYIIYPGGNANSIKMKYEGADNIFIKEGNLVVKTSVTDIIELKPYAFQEINGIRKEIPCNYVLKGNTVNFIINGEYDKSIPLVIDPVILASTFSGTTADTWGHCAAYDNAGNIFSGGRNFGIGYPVTTGAYQTSFAGGVDIVITKYNTTGSGLIYSTYIGGFADDIVQSMVANNNGELYIYGTSTSNNYPVISGCYDNSYNSNTDIIVTKLNAAGSTLLGSTYIGGNGIDGLNSLIFNYGDDFRGEIVIDANDNPYITSSTHSANFPVTTGAYDQSFNGGQDAVVFKMNSSLSSLLWSSFLGGNTDEAGYGLRCDMNGGIYIVGGTNSSNFPTTSGVLHPAYMGGTSSGFYVNIAADGFISHLNNNGSSLLASTFFGTASFDEVYFVDLDANDNVYVYGYTQGNIPPTAGVYANPGSSQFITKLDPSLNSVIYSTLFGSGSITATQQHMFGVNYSFAPTAFMVDICEQVYVAGWGNALGFPASSGALQTTTDGSDFYLMVLKKNVNQLLYATFYGDNSGTWDHVDGGTSRFDKQGIVYEAVCGCGSSFPTLSNAYSQTNNSWNCDIAVFKIDFQSIGVIADALASPSDTGCVPFSITFNNNSLNAANFIWNFGDGTPNSTALSPSHTYTSTGVYNVMLIAIDSLSCNIADTTYLQVNVVSVPAVDLGNDTSLCISPNIVLDAGNSGCTYLWSTGAITQTITATSSGTYWVSVSNGFCSDVDTINISLQNINVSLGNDTILCESNSVTLDAGNPGSIYLWSTGETTQIINVSTPGDYWVTVTQGSCIGYDTINISFVPYPSVSLGNDTTICSNDSVLLDAGNAGSSYLWSTGAVTQTITVSEGTYWISVYNQNCSDIDTVIISRFSPPNLGENVNLCIKNYVMLDAGASTGSYMWSTGATTQTIHVTLPGIYWVQISYLNCVTTDTIVVNKGGSLTIYFPNTFTPDEDGLNDYFKAYGEGIEFFEMRIFTRWGQQIFYSDNPDKAWDGTFENNPVQSDVYVWLADFRTSCSGEKKERKIGRIFLYR